MTQRAVSAVGSSKVRRFDRWRWRAQCCPVRPSGKPRDGERHGRNPIPLGRGSLTRRTALECKVVHIPDVLEDPEYTWTFRRGFLPSHAPDPRLAKARACNLGGPPQQDMSEV